MSPPLTIDSLLRPRPGVPVSTLENQPKVGRGLVADGVTPLLIKFQPAQPPAAPTIYHINLAVEGGTITNANITDHLWVYSGADFVKGADLNLSPASPVGFAYLEGFRAEDIRFNTGKTELTVSISVQDSTGRGCAKSFLIRKPPLVLVHGYASDAETWKARFIGELTNSRPSDFVIPISYGDYRDNPLLPYKANATRPFIMLCQELDIVLHSVIENPGSPLRQNWAFTRYDIAGHSQGGVLVRMLCAADGAFGVMTNEAFVNRRNRERGRFHRVVTIGSPHNGSTLYKYMDELFGTPGCSEVPAIFWSLGLLQDKFDPWGDQISEINNSSHAIDSRAKFHLIGCRLESCGWTFSLAGLCRPSAVARVIPNGSDGIVDFASQIAYPSSGGDNRWSWVMGDIAHATPGVFSADFKETESASVAARLVELMDGPTNAFGPFYLPDPATPDRLNRVLDAVPLTCVSPLAPIISPLPAAPSPLTAASSPALEGSEAVSFRMTPDPSWPVDGEPFWFAAAFGPNGISTDGILLQPASGDLTQITINISGAVRGEVVLYAGYASTNNVMIYANPLSVTNRPAGQSIVGIALSPTNLALTVGQTMPLQVWAVYENGNRSLLYIPADEPAAYSSSDTDIVEVTPQGFVMLKASGTATVSVSHRGFSSETVISTLPDFVTLSPPVAVDDGAITSTGQPVPVDVLSNDYSATRALDPSTVTITRAPTNGTASVEAFTGAITYTPNPGVTNLDTFRYTVRDDLGTPSPEATVTVQIFAPAQAPGPTSPPYYVDVRGVSPAPRDQRFPRLNNRGDVVWQERIDGLWQVQVNDGRGQITRPETNYSEAVSPAIADDGSVVYYRSRTGSNLPKDILRYPSDSEALTNPVPRVIYQSGENNNSLRVEDFTYSPEPSLTSDGRSVVRYEHNFSGTLSGNEVHESWLFIGTNTALYSNPPEQYGHPDANAQGDYVFSRGDQIFFNNRFRFNAAAASISDAPRENPDLVYANGGNLRSTILGQLMDDSTPPQPLTGLWVDVNRSGMIVFEKQVGGVSQVFKAWPLEPRILSTGATNALVGFPYQFDADNFVEAYGGESEDGDPRGNIILTWYTENAPPGFTLDPVTGRVEWTPNAAGAYTFAIVAQADSDLLGVSEHRLTLTVHVRQSTFEAMVDAVDFRVGNSPDFLTNTSAYFTGGQPRIGVVADGASRLVLRVKLEGVNTNSAQALHFVIAGTNAASGRDGHLLALDSTSWAMDVPATLVTSGGTNKAICLYESPLDFDAASQPVTIQLRHGNRIIAAQTIPLARPPVVLVHDGWNGPSEWNAMFSELLDAGMNVHFFDYALVSGTNPAAVADQLFLKNTEAVEQSRQSGFAASQVDIVAHGSGAVLARLHAQGYASQGPNYHKGAVHKLISVGGAHGGSYLADFVNAIKATNAVAFTNLRNAVLAASEAAGYFPPVDLSGSLLTNLAAISSVLLDLEETRVPGHAIATTARTLPPGDIYSLLNQLLGLGSANGPPGGTDGFVTVESATGGIATNAVTIFPLPGGEGQGEGEPNIFHSFQPFDTNITAHIVSLLREPIAAGNRFGYFPSGRDAFHSGPNYTNAPLTPGNWLTLTTAATNVMPGQSVTLTASASAGRTLQSVQFYSPDASATISTNPFTFTFTTPASTLGALKVAALGRDTNGQLALATLTLNLLPNAPFQSIEVEPTNLVFSTSIPQRLTVWGVYSNGLRRDITAGAGTRYVSSSAIRVNVNPTHGLVTPLQSPATATISITNINPAFPTSIFRTNVAVSVLFSNLPPTALITSTRTSGPAPFDVVFSGTGSMDAANHAWNFGDGTFASGATPTMHRFWTSGEHTVKLTVTDSLGLIAHDYFTVTVDPLLLINGSTQAVTRAEALRYRDVIITNAGVLTTLPLVKLDLVASNSIVIGTNSAIDATGMGYVGGTNGSNGEGPGGGAGGNRTYGGGGSYGGVGGTGSGQSLTNYAPTYGSFSEPVDFGSGGGSDAGGGFYAGLDWTRGGGAIRLRAERLKVDGVISADGSTNFAGPNGAGSGGSIHIVAGTIEGGGLIRANGGQTGQIGDTSSGAGGGGRIAVYYGDKSSFIGNIQARGGIPRYVRSTNQYAGAGTVYLKQAAQELGDLVIDNGDTSTTNWSTPLILDEVKRLRTLTVSGNARVVTDGGVRIANGDPTQFAGLISNNTLRVGGLLVSNTWVYGDVMDLEITRQEAGSSGQGTGTGNQEMALVTVYCRPERTYLLLASTNFLDWIPVATNTPTGSRFDHVDTLGIPFSGSPVLPQRFFRAVMLEHLYDGLGISMEGTGTAAAAPYRARVAVSNAQPGHTLILQASPDLHRWTSLSTNTPAAVTNWQYLDTNAPAFNQRFYRAIGQGK